MLARWIIYEVPKIKILHSKLPDNCFKLCASYSLWVYFFFLKRENSEKIVRDVIKAILNTKHKQQWVVKTKCFQSTHIRREWSRCTNLQSTQGEKQNEEEEEEVEEEEEEVEESSVCRKLNGFDFWPDTHNLDLMLCIFANLKFSTKFYFVNHPI